MIFAVVAVQGCLYAGFQQVDAAHTPGAEFFRFCALGFDTANSASVLSRQRASLFPQREDPMCLAIPGKVVETYTREGLAMARVQFGGVTREACLSYVPETQVGEYVLVHVGFAISRVDEEEARRTYEALAELDQLAELDIPEVAREGGGSR